MAHKIFRCAEFFVRIIFFSHICQIFCNRYKSSADIFCIHINTVYICDNIRFICISCYAADSASFKIRIKVLRNLSVFRHKQRAYAVIIFNRITVIPQIFQTNHHSAVKRITFYLLTVQICYNICVIQRISYIPDSRISRRTD